MSSRAWGLVFAAWVVATVATLGALFASEVMDIPPCVLCWYQRIFMFPLAIVLPMGLFPFDARVVRYGLPLAGLGGLVSLYHVLLVARVIPETMTPCTRGVPCSQEATVLGFVSLPLLSLVAFAIIVALLVAAARTREAP